MKVDGPRDMGLARAGQSVDQDLLSPDTEGRWRDGVITRRSVKLPAAMKWPMRERFASRTSACSKARDDWPMAAAKRMISQPLAVISGGPRSLIEAGVT